MDAVKAADLPERCSACGHFSPHTAFGGCGVEKFNGNRFGRCGCKARNNDEIQEALGEGAVVLRVGNGDE